MPNVQPLDRHDNRPPQSRAGRAWGNASRLVAALGASLLLGGCGGGIWYESGLDDGDDDVRPDVSIAAPATASAGSTVTLTAAAVDDWSGIEQVGFYRVEGASAVLLGTDNTRPYAYDFVLPHDGRAFVEVFAWARDRAGNERDSSVLRINLTP